MNRKAMLLPLVLLPMLMVVGCNADDHGTGKHGSYKRPKRLAVSADAPQAWREECSACHLAYPPGLLPADAWRMQMKDLGDHYGSDASLDPEAEAVILDFLLQASANNRLPVEGGTPGFPPRITETRWFLKKHDEVSPSTFKRPGIGSAANCAACHRDAEKGDFDEDRVRIPKAESQSARVDDPGQQAQPLADILPRTAAAMDSGTGKSCRVTSITSSVHCDSATGSSNEPTTSIVWTQASDGTWTCVFSGAGGTGLVPNNCTMQQSRQESTLLPGVGKSTR
ncbi:diheme cytochrome c [Pseudomonas nitroreducens]|uniref:diheme cytochrome c n=1 Tax=Pseudomonas TaxID=286 RepID=UPI000C1FB097|nr:diheme cytochrome c [Pseudomonas nitroreducens]